MVTTEPPDRSGDAPAETPIEDTDTSATPPADGARAGQAVDAVVASLIEERPRPRLSVVPPPDDVGSPPVADPLSAVLDPPGTTPSTPPPAQPRAAPVPGTKVELGEFLDAAGLRGGLNQLKGWIDKHVPGLNNMLGKLLSSVEVVINSPDAFPVPGAAAADAAKPATATPLTVVPDPEGEPRQAAAASSEIQTPNEPGPGEPTPIGDPQPGPTPGPVPVHDPEPQPDPNPQPDPVPIHDPEPQPDPNPGNDPIPIHDPPPPIGDPDPGRDPLPIGDPIGDPAPMGDPVITGSGSGSVDERETPATD